MSLDVYLIEGKRTVECVCHCGHQHTRSEENELYSGSITHNLYKMAEAAGLYKALWYPETLGIVKARHLVNHLEAGMKELYAGRARLVLLNPSNGWGDYNGLLNFVVNYHSACVLYPDADVHVSR